MKADPAVGAGYPAIMNPAALKSQRSAFAQGYGGLKKAAPAAIAEAP
jgi:hypothetical protein